MMENKTKIELKNKSIFITGVAGFIGSNLAKRLLSTVEGVKVVGLDNMNNYYDVRLKEARLKELEQFEKFSFVKGNLADKAVIESIFEQYKPEIVVNLGAQAGVRYSITNPDAYVEANLIGFYNILEACRHSYDEGHTPVEHLVYASSSSVYGSNKKVPYSTEDKVDNPVSLYAATKKSNELMAHAYSKLYNIPSTGLRFFTVYGPAGRPDMAYFGFTNKLLKGETIQIFNYGNCKRDFTYVDDIVEGVVRVMQGAPERKNGEDGLPIPPYGTNFEALKDEFSKNTNILFRGKVSNVNEYLHASDVYLATSKSEGLPNGVLEAMACGLPVLLSDIPQHMEVLEADPQCGHSYKLGNVEQLSALMDQMVDENLLEMGERSYTAVMENFTAEGMSKRYQNLYLKLMDKGGK